MMNDPVITVEKLTKYYGQTVGVEKVDFDVRRGEVFGFLGPNGAGKTTTIRLMLDLLRPTGGCIRIFGRAVPEHSLDIRRRCGYLQGTFSAYGDMKAGDFLQLAANIRGTKPALKRRLLERFDVTKENLAQKIKHLSHGTFQKIGIVQAFFHEPELVILDEPTTGLDPLMQEEFYALLRDTRRAGSTVFFSSHNLPEVEKVCERVAIIRNGELVALETLDSLKRKRYRRLLLTLREAVEHLELADTELLAHDGLQYEFLVKGPIGDLLAALANLPVADMVFPEPDLEEVFMTYYRTDKDG